MLVELSQPTNFFLSTRRASTADTAFTEVTVEGHVLSALSFDKRLHHASKKFNSLPLKNDAVAF